MLKSNLEYLLFYFKNAHGLGLLLDDNKKQPFLQHIVVTGESFYLATLKSYCLGVT